MSKKEKEKVQLVVEGYVEENENPLWEAMRADIHPDQITQIQMAQKTATCELDHAGDPRGPGPYPAENTLMIDAGQGLIAVHTCSLCASSLAETNSDWYLFICFNCMATKWVHKTDLHRDYTEQIVGMDECPNCADIGATH